MLSPGCFLSKVMLLPCVSLCSHPRRDSACPLQTTCRKRGRDAAADKVPTCVEQHGRSLPSLTTATGSGSVRARPCSLKTLRQDTTREAWRYLISVATVNDEQLETTRRFPPHQGLTTPPRQRPAGSWHTVPQTNIGASVEVNEEQRKEEAIPTALTRADCTKKKTMSKNAHGQSKHGRRRRSGDNTAATRLFWQ